MTASLQAQPIKPVPTAYKGRIDEISVEAQGRFVAIGCAAVAATLGWAAVTHIDRVTRGPARIVPQTHKQEIQHLEGGIVSEILVHEGEQVVAGQPLMRIENSFFVSEHAQATIELSAKRIRLVRLDAEVEHQRKLEYGADLRAAYPQQVAEETALFEARTANLLQQLGVLEQQRRQKEIELSQLKSRAPLFSRLREISEQRMASLSKLVTAGAASINERLAAESDVEQAMLKVSDLQHDIPRGEAALLELTTRASQLKSQFEADAEKEREQTLIDLDKLTHAIEAQQDRIKRSDVLAPASGVINKLNVSTVGGVVKAGEALAEIVPSNASIDVEMRLGPADRAEVWPGQRAIVKVSAYEASSYGGIPATVVDISPDALTDERGAPYFRVRLAADAGALGADHPVLPGMQADVDVIGRRESVLASLLRPLRRIRDNALRQ